MRGSARASLIFSGVAIAAVAIASEHKPIFPPFWEAFKAAVARDDRTAVAEMTAMPFAHQNQILDRAQFVRVYPKLFNANVKRCLAKANPLRDHSAYFVFCDKLVYTFEPTSDGRAYRFTSAHPDD